MNKILLALLLPVLLPAQEVVRLTLRDAVRTALARDPDMLLARVGQEKAERSVAAAKSAFMPSAYAGSGLGWTAGIPQSIEGATPSIVQASGRMTVYDRAARMKTRQAEASERAAGHSAAAREDEIAYRAAAAFLDLERAVQAVDSVRRRILSLNRVEEVAAARVEDGRAIALELSRARLERARAETELETRLGERDLLEATLRARLGYGDDVLLTPAASEPSALNLPETADEAAARAARNSAELKALAAEADAKRFGVKAERGALYPRLDAVAQYSVLARFNNFDDFFNRFQRNNGQIGMALRIPLFVSKGVSSAVAKASTEAREADLRLESRRVDLNIENRRLFQTVRDAESGRKLARLELDFARENLDVVLANFEEGRAAIDEVERARVREAGLWDRWYDAEFDLRKARLALLRGTGELARAFR